MPLRLKLAQDGTSRCSRDVRPVCKILVVQIDFHRAMVSWADEAAIAEAEQYGNKALDVAALHQVVRSPDGNIEMFKQGKSKQSPGRRVVPDDFVDRSQRQMQQCSVPSGG